MKEENIVKCERCGRIRKIFQYTHFIPDEFIEKVIDGGTLENPRFTTRKVNISNSQGLCEECSVAINIKKYDEST